MKFHHCDKCPWFSYSNLQLGDFPATLMTQRLGVFFVDEKHNLPTFRSMCIATNRKSNLGHWDRGGEKNTSQTVEEPFLAGNHQSDPLKRAPKDAQSLFCRLSDFMRSGVSSLKIKEDWFQATGQQGIATRFRLLVAHQLVREPRVSTHWEPSGNQLHGWKIPMLIHWNKDFPSYKRYKPPFFGDFPASHGADDGSSRLHHAPIRRSAYQQSPETPQRHRLQRKTIRNKHVARGNHLQI